MGNPASTTSTPRACKGEGDLDLLSRAKAMPGTASSSSVVSAIVILVAVCHVYAPSWIGCGLGNGGVNR